MTTAVLSQSHFRGRRDGGAVDATAEWIANEDISFTWPTECNFRIRFTVQETGGGNPAAATVKLQYNKGGAGANDVTTASSNVIAVDYSSSAEDTSITTKRLSGTGSYIAGRYSEDGSPATTVDMTASSNTEWEFAVRIKAADVANGNTIVFTLVALSGTAITTTTSPTVTVSEPAKGILGSQVIPPDQPARGAKVNAIATGMVNEAVRPAFVTTTSNLQAGGVLEEDFGIDSIVIYDPSAGPVLPPSPAAPTVVVAQVDDDVRIARRRSTDLDILSVAPPQAAAGITTRIAAAAEETSVVSSIVTYDMTAGPDQQPPAAAVLTTRAYDEQQRIRIAARPSNDAMLGPPRAPAPQTLVVQIQDDVRLARRPQNDVLLHPPRAPAPQTLIVQVDADVRLARKRAPDLNTLSIAPQQPAAVTPSRMFDQFAEPAARPKPKSWNDALTSPPSTQAAGVAIRIAAAVEDTGIVSSIVTYDTTAGPDKPPAAAVVLQTTRAYVEQPTKLPPLRPPLASGFVIAIPVDDLADVAEQPPRSRPKLRNDEMLYPARPIAAAAGVATPSSVPLVAEQMFIPARRKSPNDAYGRPEQSITVGLTSRLGGVAEDATVISSIVVYDRSAGPVLPPAAAAAYTPLAITDTTVSRKLPPMRPPLVSGFVIAIPVDDLADVAEQPLIRSKPKTRNDEVVFPARSQQAAVTTPSRVDITAEQPTVKARGKSANDALAQPARRLAAAVATASAFEQPTLRLRGKLPNDALAQPYKLVAQITTPSRSPDLIADQPFAKARSRLRFDNLPTASPVKPPPIQITTPTAYGYQSTEQPAMLRKFRTAVNYEAFSQVMREIPPPPPDTELPHNLPFLVTVGKLKSF